MPIELVKVKKLTQPEKEGIEIKDLKVKVSCKKCHGRGYVAFNRSNGQTIWCDCVSIPKMVKHEH